MYKFSIDDIIYIYTQGGYSVGLWFCSCIDLKVFSEKSVIKHSKAFDDNIM